MRVLMLTNMYPHEEDRSFGTFVSEQVRALRDAGVQVDVLFVNGRKSRWNYALAYPRLWRQLHYIDYDLIHAHYVFSGLVARAQFGLPIVQSFHAPGELGTYQGWLCRRLARVVDAAIVTSEEHQLGLGRADARVIPCGVDLKRFAPMDRRQAREDLGWDSEAKVLAWIGDPRREKRLDLARATHQELLERGCDVELKVVSKAPHEHIPIYMNAADVLLLTSDHEGSPVVIKEAMACSLPIVSTRVGDVPQVIEGVEGCYLADQTPLALADGVEQAISFGGRTNGREAIYHLSTQAEAEQIVALYREVLSK